MSTLPVRYTNHHHVVPPKTASPVVVAVNKAAVAGCVQSAQHHHHHHQKQLQRYHHHQTPPVRRHPTKMAAAARRAKSKSRTRSAATASSSSSPSKRRNGRAGAKKAAEERQSPPTAQQSLLLDVAAAADSRMVVPGMDTSLGGGGEQPTAAAAEWRTAVGGDVLRTPDAAAECDRPPVAHTGIEDQLQQEHGGIEIGGPEHQHNDHLMDTSEAMDEVASSSSSFMGDASNAEAPEAAAAVPQPRRPNEELFAELQEALALEPKYQPTLYLPQSSQDGEITIGARDGAAHVLRCLKVWYELPTDVLFAAINLVDRFLAKMKVKPKHLACISVGSLYLAAEQLIGKMNADDLALISQCRCTAGDLLRMSGIIANKLGVQPGTAPATALTFIRLFYHLFRNAAYELGLEAFYEQSISLAELEQRLEVLACDANCSSIRASELALVLICTQMDSHAGGVMNQQIGGLVDYAIEVQKLARIPDQTFFQSHAAVVAILARYNSSQHKMPYKQRLVWKLSSRTMRVLRPSNKMTSYLPTIDEHNQANFDSLSRFRTGSLSSEDDEDWPTSPVVPVYEDLC